MPDMVDEAPVCAPCRRMTRLVSGRQIYGHRPDLWDKPIYVCDGCGAYVGCHEGTTKPLGTPAGPQLRDARIKLHERMIDPLWETADVSGLYVPEDEQARKVIRFAARGRVYAFLAHRMGLTKEQTHVSLFDLEQCRAAWRALQGVTYPEIREWARAQPKPARARKSKAVPQAEGASQHAEQVH